MNRYYVHASSLQARHSANCWSRSGALESVSSVTLLSARVGYYCIKCALVCVCVGAVCGYHCISLTVHFQEQWSLRRYQRRILKICQNWQPFRNLAVKCRIRHLVIHNKKQEDSADVETLCRRV